jgi:hypothetical protein
MKIKILSYSTFCFENHAFYEKVEKYVRNRQSTDGNIKWLVGFGRQLRQEYTHSEYLIPFAFP